MKELTQQVIRILEGIQLKGRTPEGLYAPMQYTLELGGKRLRPLMALLAYRMYQEEGSTELIAPVIRAVELFHNFSLIHDDVMDNAPYAVVKAPYTKSGAITPPYSRAMVCS